MSVHDSTALMKQRSSGFDLRILLSCTSLMWTSISMLDFSANWIPPALFFPAFTYTYRDSCLKQIYSTQTPFFFFSNRHAAASFYQQRAYNPWLSSSQHLFQMIDLSVRCRHVYTLTPTVISFLNMCVCVCLSTRVKADRGLSMAGRRRWQSNFLCWCASMCLRAHVNNFPCQHSFS